ncbi:SIMPL domain-containing protein [Patescibacteria group bacterium]|nr:SIMPL domain-containing protein [Patescibacteria group bacterium]MBU1967045.1 SIMPL domain-containing protein [Patescibacteria group bacterium]
MDTNIQYNTPVPAPVSVAPTVPTAPAMPVVAEKVEIGEGGKMTVPNTIGGKLLWFLWGVVGLIIGAFIWYWVSNPLLVTVTGTGKVSVPATAATFSVSMGVAGENAGTTLTQLKTKVETLKKIMNESNLGVVEIVESQVQLTPSGMVIAGATGYQAMMSMSVKMNYVSQVADLVVELYQNGATAVGQPVISVENQEELEKQALNKALKESEKKLNEIALKKLKPIRKILSLEQASSGTTATGTKQTENMDEGTAANQTFEVVRAVSAVYALW